MPTEAEREREREREGDKEIERITMKDIQDLRIRSKSRDKKSVKN